MERAISWINNWERIDCWGKELIQRNPRLAHCIVQQMAGGKTHFVLNAPEMDHIFPRSVLRDKKFEEIEINHFANLWLLPKGRNINKSNSHPKKYFSDVPDRELKKALIDRNFLDYRRYKNFLRNRESKIIKTLEKEIRFSDKDYAFLKE